MVGVDWQLPNQLSIGGDHVVAAENLVLPVAVEIIAIGEMPSVVLGEHPFEVQLFVINPKAAVPVLDHDFLWPCISRDIDNADGIHIQPLKGVLSEFYAA